MTAKKLFLSLVLLLTACQYSAATLRHDNPPTATPTQETVMTTTPKVVMTQQATQVIAQQSLYIRSQPNYYAPVIGYLMHGETVTVHECAGIWARIGTGKWVNSLYLKKSCE